MSNRMNTRVAFAALLTASLLPATATAQTKLLRFPAIHGDRVAFTYAGDIWTAPAAGGAATRLTAHPGMELFARLLARRQVDRFHRPVRRRRAGLRDAGRRRRAEAAHVLPGPRPARPAWGYDNQVYGWTPDGKAILFRSHARFVDACAEEQPLHGAGDRRPAEALPMPTPAPATTRPTASRSSTRRSSAISARRSATRAARPTTSSSSTSRRTTPGASSPGRARTATRCGSATRSTSTPTATAPSTSTPTTSAERRRQPRSRAHDVWDVRWPRPDERRAHRLRAGRRAAGPRREDREEHRPIPITVPDDGLCEAAVSRLRREASSRTSSSAPRASAPCSRPAATSSRPRSRRAPTRNLTHALGRARQVGPLVAGRQEDRLHLRPQRRGGAVASSTRTAAASRSS